MARWIIRTKTRQEIIDFVEQQKVHDKEELKEAVRQLWKTKK